MNRPPLHLPSSESTGNEDSILEELLAVWEECHSKGQPLSAEELCVEYPHLLDQVRWKIEALELSRQQSLLEPQTRCDQSTTEPDRSPLQATHRYQHLRFLAQGGLGVVYSAQDSDLHREVAVKFIQPHLTSSVENRKQFVVEAEITGRLEHPGVVPLYGIGETKDGQPFYVMRIIKGGTLNDAIRKFHIDLKDGREAFSGFEFNNLLQHFIAACKTIAYAHNRGVLHRDIKPANIMLGVYGETLMLDWGLALPFNRDAKARASGEMTLLPASGSGGLDSSSGGGGGTPAYMSPEQAQGIADLSPASDVFSLGATLYKLITNQAPFRGENQRIVVDQVKRGQFASPRALNRQVPKPLEAICLKAMSYSPDDRYADAMDLAVDIERYLADEPISIVSDTLLQRCGRWLRRNRTLAASLVLAVFIMLIGSSIAALAFQQQARRESSLLTVSETAREQGLQLAAKFAAKTVSSEIDLRWRILETEAAGAELVSLLEAHRADENDPQIKGHLLAWLNAREIEHRNFTRATSWMICDFKGYQLARTPIADTIGQRFAFRDYFHGLGRTLSTDEAESVSPIEHAYCSMVFRSSATGQNMVAFSVPVWNSKPEALNRKIVGVLAMTVHVGEFNVLESGLGDDQIAVLVDTRPDYIDKVERSGCLLQHPGIGESGHSTESGSCFRLPEERIEQMRALIQRRGPVGNSASKLQGNKPMLVRDYHDPVSSPNSPACLAAFEPVRVHGRNDKIGNIGWVIVVQSCGKRDAE